jgi:hypothetical protein
MNVKELLLSIEESIKIAPQYGATSTKRLYPIHQVIGEWCRVELGSGFIVNGMGLSIQPSPKGKAKFEIVNNRTYPKGKEEDLVGAYKNKSVDVSCLGDEKCGTVLVKFPQSSYDKNATNAIEHLLGETANLRRANIVVAQLSVLRLSAPVLDKDGVIVKFDSVSEKHLTPYLQLYREDALLTKERPNTMCVLVVKSDSSGSSLIATSADVGLTNQLDVKTFNLLSNPELFMKEFTACLQSKK